MVDINVVKKVAHLSRLFIEESEMPLLAQQFGEIISHFEEIEKIDTSGVVPLVTPCEIEIHERNDEVAPFVPGAEAILTNAPERVGNLFKVPPVV